MNAFPISSELNVVRPQNRNVFLSYYWTGKCTIMKAFNGLFTLINKHDGGYLWGQSWSLWWRQAGLAIYTHLQSVHLFIGSFLPPWYFQRGYGRVPIVTRTLQWLSSPTDILSRQTPACWSPSSSIPPERVCRGACPRYHNPLPHFWVQSCPNLPHGVGATHYLPHFSHKSLIEGA